MESPLCVCVLSEAMLAVARMKKASMIVVSGRGMTICAMSGCNVLTFSNQLLQLLYILLCALDSSR